MNGLPPIFCNLIDLLTSDPSPYGTVGDVSLETLKDKQLLVADEEGVGKQAKGCVRPIKGYDYSHEEGSASLTFYFEVPMLAMVTSVEVTLIDGKLEVEGLDKAGDKVAEFETARLI